jgi:hypothetical protein
MERRRVYGERVTERKRGSWVRAIPLDEAELARRGITAAKELGRDDPLWPGQLGILAVLVLYLVLPQRLTIGPNWIVPAAELALLVALFIAARREGHARKRRAFAIGFLLIATVANLTAVGLLTHYLIIGGHARGVDLINGGAVIWCTNLLLFAVWYWELDRGGPPVEPQQDRPPVVPDFLFPQMTDERYAEPGWKPNFLDYLYVSLTNQTAFSPTDAMPLGRRIKLLMAIQAVASLITVGIIVARAVNILA